MEAKEHDLIFNDSDEELEAKQHDLVFDDPEEEEETLVEVNNFETVQVSDVDSTRKIYEDEGVNFDMMLQAQQANTRLQAHTHELLDSDSSDEESVTDLEVNMHNFRAKIQGLLEFSNSEDKNKQDPNCSANMDEAVNIDAEARSMTLTCQKISQSNRSPQLRCLKECFNSPTLKMKRMKTSSSCEHMASHHPSKRQSMPMEQMHLQALVTKVLLVNKKVISLVSPIAMQTGAN